MAAMAMAPALFNACRANSWDKLGIILNTVRDEMKKDPVATLKTLKEIGYTYLEGGPSGDAREFAKTLSNIGLKMVAGGSSMHPMLQDLDKTLKDAETLQYDHVVCYWPWIGSAENLSRDDFMEATENLNKIGKKCKEAGFGFVFHNHDKEFKRFGEEIGFDILMHNTDPAWVSVELDLYWILKAGFQPLPFFEKYPGRFPIFHLKDMDNTTEKERVCVGDGIIGFGDIFEHAEKAGLKYPIVENEVAPAGTQVKCARDSYNYLKTLGI